MSLPEHEIKDPLKTPDLLPTLRVSFAQWQILTRETIDSEHALLRKEGIRLFIGDPQLHNKVKGEPNSGSAKRLFDQEIASLLEKHRQANSGKPIHDSDLLALRGKPIVHIIYTRDSELGYQSVGYGHPDLTFDTVVKAAEAQNWDGLITVDFTKVDPASLKSTREDYEHVDYMEDLLKRPEFKAPVFIIDGWGRYSTISLGARPNTFGAGISLGYASAFWARTNIAQLDPPGSVASAPELLQLGQIVFDGASLEEVSRYQRTVPFVPNFQPERFHKLAYAIDEIVRRVEAGEKVCLQSPRGFGKTSTLSGLYSALDYGQDTRTDLKVAEIKDYDGVLHTFGGFKIESVQDLINMGIKTIIVDEIERADVSGAPAKEVLVEAEKAGINIVHVYPENAAPPLGFEVVSVV